MAGKSEEKKILTEITGLIREVIGKDFDESWVIGMDTSFNHDLELESIEFVVLAEKVQKKYGTEADLMAWFAGKELNEMINLKVGDLVQFIAQQV